MLPLDPALAGRFIQAAQEIIDQLTVAISSPSVGGAARLKALVRQANGKTWMQFEGAAANLYIIEASSDLMSWEMIGVAADRGNGTFEFEDANAARYRARYYRITLP